ncbi:MAG: sulfite oxidase [Planctomycetota bacterium]
MSDLLPDAQSSPSDGGPLGTRRSLLASALGLAAGAGALASCGEEPAIESATADDPDALPFDLDASYFVNHGTAPLTLETKRALLDGLITPTERVFVRNNNGPPAGKRLVDPSSWSVAFEGFGDGRSMTLAELQGLGRETMACVLQCSGNGRRFFSHGASGSQWGVGAAANVVWTGVSLARVSEALGGPAAGARFVTATGGDQLPPIDDVSSVVVERSVPLEHALSHAMLAWSMNGAPIPVTHGGPLRLVVPGYYGINQVKYVERLALTAEESTAKIQARGYRVRPIGESGDPSQPSMWEMNVKSWITSPLETSAAGDTFVTGVAFSGAGAIDRVEVSVDGGATWGAAEFLGPDLGPFAWRTFALPWKATAGTHRLVCRATDAAGETQPEERLENERGYRHNGWRDHGVDVTVS